jgi:integral membrane protein
MSPRWLCWVARAEGLSYVLLVFVAMPIKHALGEPLPVRLIGAIHGVLFLAWLLTLVRVARASRWPRDLTWLGFVTSMIPFGFVFFEAALAEHASLLAAQPAPDPRAPTQ